jgi:hypothetical protein
VIIPARRAAGAQPLASLQQHDADMIGIEVQRDAVESPGELQHFSGHGSVEPVDLGNTVADLDDRAGLLDIDLLVEALDLSGNSLRQAQGERNKSALP